MKLPMGDEVVALTGEIVLGDIRDAVRSCSLSDRSTHSLRNANHGCRDLRGKVSESLRMCAWDDEHVVTIDWSPTHDSL